MSPADEVILTTGRRVAAWILGTTDSYWVLSTERGIEVLSRDAVDTATASRSGPAVTPGLVGGAATTATSIGDGPVGRRIALTVRATVGDEKLDSTHLETRGRLGYFLERECKPPFDLVDAGEAADRADYEMVVDATSKEEGPITFYGLNLGYRYRCRLKFELRQQVGPRVRVVESLSIIEDVSGSEDQRETLAARAYDQAIEALTRRLGSLPFFGGDGEGAAATDET